MYVNEISHTAMEDFLVFSMFFFVFVSLFCLVVGLITKEGKKSNTQLKTNRTNDNSLKEETELSTIFPKYKEDLDKINDLFYDIPECKNLYSLVDTIDEVYQYSLLLEDIFKAKLSLIEGDRSLLEELGYILKDNVKRLTLLELKENYNCSGDIGKESLSNILDSYMFLTLDRGNKVIEEYNNVLKNDEKRAIKILENFVVTRPAYSAIYDILQPYYEKMGLFTKSINLQCIKQEAFRADNARIVSDFICRFPNLSDLAILYLFREKPLPEGSLGNNKIHLFKTKLMFIGDVYKDVGEIYKHDFNHFCTLVKDKTKSPILVRVESDGPKKELSIESKGRMNEESAYSKLVYKWLRFRSSKSYRSNYYYQNKEKYKHAKDACFSYIDRVDTLDTLKKLYSCLMFCYSWFYEFHIAFIVRKIKSDTSSYLTFDLNQIYDALNKNIVRLAENSLDIYISQIKNEKETSNQDTLTIDLFKLISQLKKEIRNHKMDYYLGILDNIKNKIEDIYSDL